MLLELKQEELERGLASQDAAHAQEQAELRALLQLKEEELRQLMDMAEGQAQELLVSLCLVGSLRAGFAARRKTLRPPPPPLGGFHSTTNSAAKTGAAACLKLPVGSSRGLGRRV
eukprot:COSAG01_NODE_11301_length_1963_cov_8.909335_3_plen_115_part_00